jgi:hypothetical protein
MHWDNRVKSMIQGMLKPKIVLELTTKRGWVRKAVPLIEVSAHLKLFRILAAKY